MTGAGAAVELSVVAPVYDERENLDALVDELVRTLDAAALQFEILLVDDGSTDGSSARIAELARASAGRVRGIHFRANRGQTAAFDAGFRAARGHAASRARRYPTAASKPSGAASSRGLSRGSICRAA